MSIKEQLQKILKSEGFSGYYKGFGASMLNTFSMRTHIRSYTRIQFADDLLQSMRTSSSTAS